MADEIIDGFEQAFRDFQVDGVPASGVNNPWKSEARNLGQIIQGEVDNLRDGQTAGVIVEKTWAALAARTTGPTGAALVAGVGAEITGDVGTHTDPVVGGTVSNSGRFRYSTAPAGWERIGDPAFADNVAAAEAAQTGAETARDEAAGYVAPVGNLVASGDFEDVREFELSGYTGFQRTDDGFLIGGEPVAPSPPADPTAPMGPIDLLVGIGHSMVENGITAAIATALADPARLGVTLPSANLGISGANSRGIVLHTGARPIRYRPVAGVIPPAAGEAVTLEPADSGPCGAFGDAASSRHGLLAGVPGLFIWSGAAMTFEREYDGRAVSVPEPVLYEGIQYDRDVLYQHDNVDPDIRRKVVEDYRNGFAVLWAIRNNIASEAHITTQIRMAIEDYEALIARLRPIRKGFVILSELNGTDEPEGSNGYARVVAINAALAKRWPREFVDVRTPLVAAYDPGNPTDVANHDDDIPPSTLRYDYLHPNADGRAVIAEVVADAIMSRRLLEDVAF